MKQQKKKTPFLLWLVIVPVFIVFIIALTHTGTGHNNKKPAYSENVSVSAYVDEYTVHNIEYEVRTGYTEYSEVFITYTNADGGTSQKEAYFKRNEPWTYSFGAIKGNFLYVSAQLTDPACVGLHVSIYVDGVKMKTSASSGEYVIAEAHYSLP